MKKDINKVIFRKLKNNSIIAIFPEVPDIEKENYQTCIMSDSGGYHYSANIYTTMKETRPATPEEYARIKKFLETVFGYTFKVLTRTNIAHYYERTVEIQKIFGTPFNSVK